MGDTSAATIVGHITGIRYALCPDLFLPRAGEMHTAPELQGTGTNTMPRLGGFCVQIDGNRGFNP